MIGPGYAVILADEIVNLGVIRPPGELPISVEEWIFRGRGTGELPGFFLCLSGLSIARVDSSMWTGTCIPLGIIGVLSLLFIGAEN
jgi:hypothetical protein